MVLAWRRGIHPVRDRIYLRLNECDDMTHNLVGEPQILTNNLGYVECCEYLTD